MAKYRLVQLVESDWLVTDFSEDNVVPALEVRGYSFQGIAPGGRQLRDELKNRPKFDGLAGPCWGGVEDGQPVIRYENWAAYNKLCD